VSPGGSPDANTTMAGTRYCAKCGHPIHFVKLGGRVRPIHEGGQSCPANTRSHPRSLEIPTTFPDAFQEPVKSEPCHCQQNHVLTVQHKDGVSRFNQLVWPWQRHQCAHTKDVDYGLDFLMRTLAGEAHHKISLGLVAGAKRLGGSKAVHIIAVLDCAEQRIHRCLKVQCDPSLPAELIPRAKIAAGSLVGICENGSIHRVVNTSGYAFDCVDYRCSPEELDIPADWVGDPLHIKI
jgi:hypothetical protein